MFFFWVSLLAGGGLPATAIHSLGLESAPVIHYVSTTGLHVVPYTNWADAATNIQSAIDAAGYGDMVLVTDGTYMVNSEITLTNGVMIAAVNGPDSTIVNGQHSTRCLRLDHPDAVVWGLTLANGSAPQRSLGGGVACDRGRVDSCVIRNSQAYWAGGVACGTGGAVVNSLIVSNQATGLDWEPGTAGGVYCYGGRIENCVVRDNIAQGDGSFGGGVVCAFSASLVDSFVTGNRAIYAAGAFCGISSRVDRCTISRNAATGAGSGGGLWVWGGDALTSIVAGNTARTGAGVVLGPIEAFGSVDPSAIAATSRLVNCTVVDNTAFAMAAGVLCGSNSVVQSSIVWTNEAPLSANVATGTAATVFLFTCTDPLLPGIGNIDAAPQLTPSYRLRSSSPCIDAGTSSDAPALDIDGEARWDHPTHSNVVSNADIGADEFVDTDIDNMADFWESQEFGSVTNRDGTADTDSDRLNDLGEYNNSTTPTNPDTDADAMPDGWEVTHALDPLADDAQGDADADPMRNLGEYIADTDPHDSGSFLGLLDVRPEVGGMRVDWQGGRDAWQLLEISADLRATNWAAIYGLPPPTPSTNAVIHFGTTNQVLFYRIRAFR